MISSNALMRAWLSFFAIFSGLGGVASLFLSNGLIGFGLLILSALIAIAIYYYRDATVSLSGYASELKAQLRPEQTVGQSSLIEIGLSSPTLRLPPDFSADNRRSYYLASLRVRPDLTGVDVEALYERWRQELPSKYYNDPNVFIDRPVEKLASTVDAYPCDFSVIVGFEREFGIRLQGVTGNVLAVSKDGNRMYLLNRGKVISKDAPDQYHVFGGATDPTFDQGSMAKCAEREFHEEAGTTCEVYGCPVILHRESAFSKSMITFLGAPMAYATNYESEEGKVVWLRLDDIDSVVQAFSKPWVDSGRQAALVWFALGCPVAGHANPTVTRPQAKLLLERCLTASGLT